MIIVQIVAHVALFLLCGIAIFGCRFALSVGIVWKEFIFRARSKRRSPR